MIIFNSINDYAKAGYPSCVALGFFDGVHLGHKKVICTCKENSEGLKCTVLTFKTAPAISKEKKTPLLSDNSAKARLIKDLGADNLIFADFEKIKNISADDFIYDILIKRLHSKKIFCGFNYRFGKDGRGDTDLLKKICDEQNIELYVSKPVICDKETVSSTRIRELIANGEISLANKMLGYCFTVSGIIEEGLHNGKSLSFPTINISLEDGIVEPRFGVYRSSVRINDKTYTGATNIGMHPTLGNVKPLCETYLIGYEGDSLYGEYADVKLLDFIREERKFSCREELTAQIEKDKNTIMHM